MLKPLPIVEDYPFTQLPKYLMVPSPWGTLELELFGKIIMHCKFIDDVEAPFRQFHLPADCMLMRPIPSEFEIAIKTTWMATNPGELITYGDLAERAGQSRRAAQAVGNAMACNNFALIIPCHRVISANGKTDNYRWGSWRKQAILEHERNGGDDLFIFDK